MTDSKTRFVLYQYEPSLPAAIIAVAVFALITSAHTWKLFKHRTFYFTPFVIGGIFETIGYSGRIWGHFNSLAIGGYVMQSLLILLAPALFAASIYMILSRLIIALHAEKLAIIPVTRLTLLFVLGDVFSFLLQLSGGGLLATGSPSTINTGQKLIIAGLFAQIAFFGFFVVVSIVFNVRARRARLASMTNITLPWQRHLVVLYVTSALILVRSIFRVVDYLQGNSGYLMSHEVFLYIFDMLPMFSVMVIFLIWYIADLQPAHDRAQHAAPKSMEEQYTQV